MIWYYINDIISSNVWSKLLEGRKLRMVWGRVTLCRATHNTWVSALGCLTIRSRTNSKANGLAMLKHLFPLVEYRSEATSGQSVLGWVTALWVCVRPISKETAEQLLASGVVSHREELIQFVRAHPQRGYPLVGPGPMTCDPTTSKTNDIY
jgi:hypothetical protein